MEEINIKDFLSYLKRYILALVIFAAVAVVGVLIYDNQIKKPIYQAQTTVVIAKSSETDIEGNSTAATLNEINASQKLAATYSEIAKSELVLNQVIGNLGLNTDTRALGKNLTVKAVDDTAILAISVKDESARVAAVTANEIAKVFAAEVMEIYKVENVKQLSVAEAPEQIANNTTSRDLVLAALAAVVAVGGFAFLKFYLDDSVKHDDDVEKMIGVPIAGQIIRGEAKYRRPGNELIVERSPKSAVSENMKSLRTNLQFTAVDGAVKTILITSTNASEGKSFVSANLAVSFAQADKKVLLVDCDLRRGRAHKLFGINNTMGLSNLLMGDIADFREYVHETKTKGLQVMTCGTYPPNPSELLASKKNEKLIKKLAREYDVVIFDGAPVGGLADSVILASLMDETLIVVKDAETKKADLLGVKESLEKVGARIAGVVFNMVNRKATRYYNSYYYGNDK